MGLTMEGRGHTLHHVSNYAPFKSAGMIMAVCTFIAHGMYRSVIRPYVKNPPFHRGRGDDHVGACFVLPMAMYPVRVLGVCSLCYIVVPAIWGALPPLSKLVHIYIYTAYIHVF